jgi:hypothetical protein
VAGLASYRGVAVASPIPQTVSARDLLRHCVATIAYRGGKVLRDVPDSFAKFQPPEKARTPEQIVAHIGDLFDWALSMAKGEQAWKDSQPLPWAEEVERFFAMLKRFDDYLEGNEPLHASPEKLFQGPVADALNHVGQIAMLRRLAGIPMKGENYFKADIAAGRVGPQQSAPKREFD